MTLPLFAHQNQTIAFGGDKNELFDTSDPGTGKTRSVIEIAKARIAADGRSIVVVSPKSLVRSAWATDLAKFAPELKVACAFAENRAEAFAEQADFYVTNYEGVHFLAQQDKKFMKRFSTLVLDESGAFKHPTSKRSRAAAKVAPQFDFRINLNGTPNPNTICDVWHQYYLLDKGQRLGKSFFRFRNQVCVPIQVGPLPNMVKWEDREGIENVVSALVKDITIRHVFEECVDIPPNTERPLAYDMRPKQARAYYSMQKNAVAALETGLVSAAQASAVATKLLQIASGAVYSSEGVYHIIDEERNEMIMDLLEERKHSLVFFNWKHQKDQLVDAAQRRGFSFCVLDGESTNVEREEAVRMFEAGFYKVMFAHPQSAAHGLTLVRATTTIWASPTYNLDHFVQGNRRIYRAGQTNKTETIVVLARGTIDEKVYTALAAKKIRMASLLEELKDG